MNKPAHREALLKAQRWVIKIGSSLVTSEGHGLNHDSIHDWSSQISALRHADKQVVLVSSGAISEGMYRLGWKQRPYQRHQIQAAAATGQMGLIHAYEAGLSKHGLCASQILLTHEDLSNRSRYLNARATIGALLDLNVIPIVNENDTVATDEIQLGDNDTLAALVANLTDADALLILTDQAGLYDANPNQNQNAVLIDEAQIDDPLLDKAAGPSMSEIGRGGMITKIRAARRAALSGTTTIIASGHEEKIITRIVQGEALGTWIKTDKRPVAARKQWIASLKPAGSLVLDEGACVALAKGGNSLLPIGVTEVCGNFQRGDLVECTNEQGQVIARGLSNYSTKEAQQIAGKHSKEVRELMGAAYESEIVHRDNLWVE